MELWIWALWGLLLVVAVIIDAIIDVYKKAKLEKNTEDIANEDR